MTYRALLQLPINGFKTNGVHFVLCPKQGNKIEGSKQGFSVPALWRRFDVVQSLHIAAIK